MEDGEGDDNDDAHIIQPLPNIRLEFMGRAHDSRRMFNTCWDKYA
jgi:hypothetical protein